MVNSAPPANTAHPGIATGNVWRHPALNPGNLEADIPVAREVSDSLVTNVAHVDENYDRFSSYIAILLETDIDLHLGHRRGAGEQRKQAARQHSAHGAVLPIPGQEPDRKVPLVTFSESGPGQSSSLDDLDPQPAAWITARAAVVVRQLDTAARVIPSPKPFPHAPRGVPRIGLESAQPRPTLEPGQ